MNRSASSSIAAQVRELAWAGQHAQAIEHCSQALQGKRLAAAARIELLDLRAQSFIAQGRFADAALDARAMQALAAQQGQAADQSSAHICLAMAQMRQGDVNAALTTATQAHVLAHKVADAKPRNKNLAALLGRSLLCLGEAQIRAADVTHVTAR